MSRPCGSTRQECTYTGIQNKKVVIMDQLARPKTTIDLLYSGTALYLIRCILLAAIREVKDEFGGAFLQC